MAKQKKASIRSRNARRQATPPLIIPTEPPSGQLSGVSRVNQEIATLIARKDPVLNSISKKSKPRVGKQKKGRLEAKMIKAAAKAVSSECEITNDQDQLEVKKAKAQNKGKEIKKRRADWDAINEKKVSQAETVEKMKIDDN